MDRREFAELICGVRFPEMAVVPGDAIHRRELGAIQTGQNVPSILLVPGGAGEIPEAARALRELADEANATVLWTLGTSEIQSVPAEPWVAAKQATEGSRVRVLCRDEVDVDGTRFGGCSLVPDGVGEPNTDKEAGIQSLDLSEMRDCFRADCEWLADAASRTPEQDDMPYVILTSTKRRHVATVEDSISAVSASLSPQNIHGTRGLNRVAAAGSRYAFMHVTRSGIYLPQRRLDPKPLFGIALRGSRMRVQMTDSRAGIQHFSLADPMYDLPAQGIGHLDSGNTEEAGAKHRYIPHIRTHIRDWLSAVVAIDLLMRARSQRYYIETLPLAAIAGDGYQVAGVYAEGDTDAAEISQLEEALNNATMRFASRAHTPGRTRVQFIQGRNVDDVLESVPMLGRDAINAAMEVLEFSYPQRPYITRPVPRRETLVRRTSERAVETS